MRVAMAGSRPDSANRSGFRAGWAPAVVASDQAATASINRTDCGTTASRRIRGSIRRIIPDRGPWLDRPVASVMVARHTMSHPFIRDRPSRNLGYIVGERGAVLAHVGPGKWTQGATRRVGRRVV